MSKLGTNQTAENLAEHAKSAMHAAQDGAGNAAKRAQDGAEYAREHSEDMLSSVSDYVQDHPIKSLGLAVAAGTLLSALARRR